MTPKDNGEGVKPEDAHWVRTLYERYVQLYGDPIEQPITMNEKTAGGDDQHPG